MSISDPMTDTELLRSLWEKMKIVEQQVKYTNGRLRTVERFCWALAGGLTVLAAVVVPQYIQLVSQ